MSEPFGTTEELDLESIEKRLDAIARPGSWTMSMPTMAEVDRLNLLLAMARLVKKDVPALTACVRELKAENATWQERDDLMNRCERAKNEGRHAYEAGTPITDCPYNEPGPDGITYGDLIETWMLAHRNAEYEAERDAENAIVRKQLSDLRYTYDATLEGWRDGLARIGELEAEVARYRPLYDAVYGMRRGQVLRRRSEGGGWAAYQIGYPPVNGDTPQAALGVGERGEDVPGV